METELLPLGELGEIVSGSTPRTGVSEFWNGEIPWVTPADLTSHEGVWFTGKPKRITKVGFAACSTRMLPPGSILFSSRAPIGHCAVAAYPLCTNQGFKSLVPNEQLDPVYGYFALRFVTPSIVAQGRGATFAEVSKEIMENIRIPVAPLPEQKRIAAILEKADRLRRVRRYAHQLSDTFLQSVFLEMFGHPLCSGERWEENVISSVAEIIVPTRDKPKMFSGDVPWITLPDLDGLFVSHGKYSLTHEEAAQVSNRLMPPQTVLLSCAGSVGKVAVTTRYIYANQQFYGLVAKRDRIEPLFLALFLHLLGEPFFFRLAGVSTLAFFSKEKALGIIVKVPPLPLQQKFADVVRRFERLRAQQREAQRQAEHLFHTLLHRAFNGGI